MPADTAAKRYSAMNIASPWRGLNVVPDAAIPPGERYAVMYLYGGISAAPPTPVLGDNPGGMLVGRGVNGPSQGIVVGYGM